MPFKNGIFFTQFEEKKNPDSPIFKPKGLIPPVLLIHGAGASHLSWPGEIRRLPHWQVLTVDLPGHGQSGGIAHQSIEKITDVILNFLMAIESYRIILVGHSLGGAIALNAAIAHPGQIAGIAVISSAAYFGVSQNLLHTLSNPVTYDQGIDILRNKAFGDHCDPRLIERSQVMLQKNRPSVLYADWKACAAVDLQETVHKISCPALIICGKEDKITPPACSYDLATRIPRAKLEIVSNAGHMAILEKPKIIANALTRFLNPLIQVY